MADSKQATGGRVHLRDALPVDTQLRGYLIEEVLGYGGYGVVYRARHEELGHSVAIKEYLPAELSVREGGIVRPRGTDSLVPYKDGRRRFLEEAKRIVQFKGDPGVVALLDFFRANGTAYLVMEYVDGVPLSQLLAARESAGSPLSEAELRSLVDPLLATLGRLHDANVLHRDIKPSNILVNRADGQPVLIDFGAAKQGVAQHTKSLAPFTEGYAALEQVGEGELGPWTDLYAVGAVMWRIIAGGRPPWTPPNPKRVELRASAQLSGKPDPMPSAVELGAGRCSAQMLKAVDRCLMLREDKRIAKAEDLSDALCVERDAAAEPQPSVKPAWRWQAAWLAVAAVAIGVAGWTIAGGGPGSGKAGAGEVEEVPTTELDEVAGNPKRPARLGLFTIETVPPGATVDLLDSTEPYEAGMALPANQYEVEVGATGYATVRRIVMHGESDSKLMIELRELEQPPLESGTERDLLRYVERWREVAGGEAYVRDAAVRLAELSRERRDEESGGLQQTGLGAFTVETVPAGATVDLLDTSESYTAGMMLPFDKYEVEVRAAGYATVRRSVAHGGSDTVLLAELRRLERPPLEDGTEAELTAYVKRFRDIEGGEEYVSAAEGRLAELRHERREKDFRGLAEFSNSVGMEFIRIPAGEFLMGSLSDLAYPYERPITRIQIRSAFWMSKHEITQMQWTAIMGNNPSRHLNCGRDCPVENVSWFDVQEFVDRLNSKEETSQYRLPTESEWEYAARGGTTTDTPKGDLDIIGERNAPLLDSVAWYGGNSEVMYAGGFDCLDWEEKQSQSRSCGPHPVGSKASNSLGLYDMLGNVAEWVHDRHDKYPGGFVADPTGPESGSFRVVRGCSWFSYARYCRAANRNGYSPDYRLDYLGFRLLRVD